MDAKLAEFAEYVKKEIRTVSDYSGDIILKALRDDERKDITFCLESVGNTYPIKDTLKAVGMGYHDAKWSMRCYSFEEVKGNIDALTKAGVSVVRWRKVLDALLGK